MCGPFRALYVEYWRSLMVASFVFFFPRKQKSCLTVLSCHIGITLPLALFLLVLGLWYLVALAGTGVSPVAREI
jgi:hypothetical protein